MENCVTIHNVYAKPDVLLLDHLLDVGAIAEGLMKYGRAKSAIESFSSLLSIDKTDLVSSISFLCAVHDIGKAHPVFQQRLLGGQHSNEQSFRHERYSAEIIKSYLLKRGFGAKAEEFAYIIAYHHQDKQGSLKDTIPACPKMWTELHGTIISEIEKHWRFSVKLQQIDYYMCGFCYFVLGVMIVADWIASGLEWKRVLVRESGDRKQATQTFIRENALLYDSMGNKLVGVTWSDIFPFTSNAIQSLAMSEAKKGFDLMIIEAPCGQGKTEAGLAAAAIAGKNKSGLYFALPTTATAKAMLPRVREIAQKCNIRDKIPEFDGSVAWADDNDSSIDADLWVAASRHHMLYPFAVGTVDQAMKTVGAYKYAAIGLVGMSDKALVIDEVHAYDAFMLTEIEVLLRYCRMLKVPVVLLSATLPVKTKERLLAASGGRVTCSGGYPLITVCRDRKVFEIPCVLSGKITGVDIKTVESMSDAMYDMAMTAPNGCSLFVAPTVDAAIALYKKLKDSIASDVELFLYHSRDTIQHKAEKSRKLIELFGKDRTHRPKKAIVIATSIVEQSLDIDMDYLITALAPIDLLIQRMGRQGRHSDTGTVRESGLKSVPVTVLVPKKLGVLTSIYDEDILKQTVATLKSVSSVDTIADVAALVNQVYNSVDMSSSDRISALEAGWAVIANPGIDTPNATDSGGRAYEEYRRCEPITRQENYPTVQVAFISEAEQDILDDAMFAKKIYRERVVAIGKTKVKDLADYQEYDGLLKDVRLYLSENNRIEQGGHIMVLDECGLRVESGV